MIKLNDKFPGIYYGMPFTDKLRVIFDKKHLLNIDDIDNVKDLCDIALDYMTVEELVFFTFQYMLNERHVRVNRDELSAIIWLAVRQGSHMNDCRIVDSSPLEFITVNGCRVLAVVNRLFPSKDPKQKIYDNWKINRAIEYNYCNDDEFTRVWGEHADVLTYEHDNREFVNQMFKMRLGGSIYENDRMLVYKPRLSDYSNNIQKQVELLTCHSLFLLQNMTQYKSLVKRKDV